MARADQLDAEFRAATTLAEKTEETVSNVWGKHKIYDVTCLGERSPEKDAACRE